MERKSSRIIQTLRDAVVLLLSLVFMSTSYGKWVTEPAHLVLFSIAAVLFALTVVNLILNVFKVKRKGYFYTNSIFQLIIGLLLLGLVQIAGILLVSFNIAILVSLREKRSLEEQLKHPPVPITRNYRIAGGAGLPIILLSMFLPSLTTSDASASIISIYAGILSRSNLPGLSIAPVAVIFALLGLILPPVSLICGALGLIKRLFSLMSGIFAILAGVSLMIVLTASTGPGAFGFILGGVMVLVGYSLFRRTK